MVGIEDLRGLTFQNEALAHTFKISGVDADGSAIALTGTPAGVMLRADNMDVALTCAISDGCVTASLPAECYDVPGRAEITIYLTEDGHKVCIYAAIVSVNRTSSGTASPGTAADVVDLVNLMQTSVDAAADSATAAAGSATSAAASAETASAAYNVNLLAPNFVQENPYPAGQHVIYDGGYYVLPNGHEADVTWANTSKTQLTVGGELTDLKSALTQEQKGKITVPQNLFEQGTYTGGGLPIGNENVIRTPVVIPVYSGCVVNCIPGQNVQAFNYVKWDSTKTRTGAGSAYVSSLKLTVDWDGYIAFVCKRTTSSTNTALTPSEYDATITITSYTENKADAFESLMKNTVNLYPHGVRFYTTDRYLSKYVEQAYNTGDKIKIKFDIKESDYTGTAIIGVKTYKNGVVSEDYITTSDNLTASVEKEHTFASDVDGLVFFGYSVASATITKLVVDVSVMNAIDLELEDAKIGAYNSFQSIGDNIRNAQTKILGKDNLNYSLVSVENVLLQNLVEDATKWNNGTITKADGTVTFTSDGSTIAGGIRGAVLTSDKFKNGFMKIALDVDSVSVSTFQLVIYAKKTDNTAYNHYVATNLEAGKQSYVIDLSYMGIYEDFDGTKPFIVLIFNTAASGTIQLSEYSVIDYYNDDNTDMMHKVLQYDRQISSLQVDVQDSLRSSVLVDTDGKHYALSVKNGTLQLIPQLPSNVLFIGNSLLTGINSASTGHSGITAFGMAASNMNEDYAARILSYLTAQGISSLTYDKTNAGGYETAKTQQEEEDFLYDLFHSGYYLNENRQLVLIQLGDNVNNSGGYDRVSLWVNGGAERFIAYIREHAPNARIGWIAEWYSTPEKQEAIRKACRKYGGVFIDVSDLPVIAGNQSHIGAEITLSDGGTYTVASDAVATHPSSAGFQAITNRVISMLFE